MKDEQRSLFRRKDTYSRKFECVILAMDKKAEPYTAWIQSELNKRSKKDLEFRSNVIKCYESALAKEETLAQHSFENGSFFVISCNSVNEEKRSVTVHLCMNGLNQIHKNMGVADAFKMIDDQWAMYQNNLAKQKTKTAAPPNHVQAVLKWVNEGKMLKHKSYDDAIHFLLEKRNEALTEEGLTPAAVPFPFKSEVAQKVSAKVTASNPENLLDKISGMFGKDGAGLKKITDKDPDVIEINSGNSTPAPNMPAPIPTLGSSSFPTGNLPPPMPGLPGLIPGLPGIPPPINNQPPPGMPPINIFNPQMFR